MRSIVILWNVIHSKTFSIFNRESILVYTDKFTVRFCTHFVDDFCSEHLFKINWINCILTNSCFFVSKTIIFIHEFKIIISVPIEHETNDVWNINLKRSEPIEVMKWADRNLENISMNILIDAPNKFKHHYFHIQSALEFSIFMQN